MVWWVLATDVAAEMAEVQSEMQECEMCTRALSAAVSMLAVSGATCYL